MGRIALLSALAAVLVAGAFSFPWYTYRYSVSANSTTSSDQWHANGFIHFYPDHSTDEDGDLMSYAAFWHEPMTPLASVFSSEAILAGLWVLVAMAFIGLVFMDFQLQSLVAGAFVFIVGLLMILIFVLRFGAALADSSILSTLHLPAPAEVGFLGHHTDEWTSISWSYVQSVRFGPSWGLGMLLLAFALQTIAFALRSNVAMPAIIKERRRTRDYRVLQQDSPTDSRNDKLPPPGFKSA